MKTVLVSVLCLFSTVCLGQDPIDSIKYHISDNQVVYEKIVITDTLLTKAKLFAISQEWFAKTFNSGKSVIQSQDIESGRIVGKGTGGNFTYMDEPFVLNFIVQIDVKDKKARIRINDLAYQWLSSSYSAIQLYNEYTKDEFSLKPMFFSKKMVRKEYLDYLTQVNHVGLLLVNDFSDFIKKYKKDDF